MNKLSTMLFQVVTVEQCCNNMLTILFIVGRTTLFTPVDINLQQVVDFLNFYACITRVKIEKINNLFQVDINRREQCCEPTMNSIVNMLLQHCSTVTTWNNMVDNLFIVGRTTLFAPACRYQLGTTCAFLAVYTAKNAEPVAQQD